MNQKEIDKAIYDYARALRAKGTNEFTLRTLVRAETRRLARLNGDVTDHSIHPRNFTKRRPATRP